MKSKHYHGVLGIRWVDTCLAIDSHLRHSLEGKASGLEHKLWDSILGKAHHLFRLVREFVRTYLAVGSRLHQSLLYTASLRHGKELGKIMDMSCHHILLVHKEVCKCPEVDSRSRQFLLGTIARWEHT